MASCNFLPDVWTWITNLPPTTQWKSDIISISICPSNSSLSSSSQPSLKLCVTKDLKSSSVFLSIIADYNLPIYLWTSKPQPITNSSMKLLDSNNISNILLNFIEAVLKYCPNKNISLFRLPRIDSEKTMKDILNLVFLTLTFVICIYESPADLRSPCLNTLKNQLACPESRAVSKTLMRLLGSNVEEQWVRTFNLGITNWIEELKSANHLLRTPSPLFSYSVSSYGMWKVQLYCPVIAMEIQSSNHTPSDDRLLFSLNYHQLEGVIQLNYKVDIRDNWIDVFVHTDNIRCDVVSLITETLMNERGAGTTEKHFPARISLQLTPIMQANVLSISVGKSSENPTTEIGFEKGIEGSFDPQTVGISISAAESTTMSIRPWKFEQSVRGASTNLNWFLHDSGDGKEVYSSRPSKFTLLQPKAWFKNRYSSVHRPFTRQGGVIFARDEYGESVCWKVDKSVVGKSMEWEIRGWIWLTYWPNKHRTFYTETRRLEFREVLNLNLV
ncbi:hypothetical protein Leryth_022462 [Lithospermum erythrorhizon]|uniref:Uncharacterized protein n=1 Tax=Lithospermum erythrorhizon TaxID=34254 RepID=A0AAV3RZY4_LITER|nr:hypothetical protein Leryth_022462 [Lithospermum erythrorhizon]